MAVRLEDLGPEARKQALAKLGEQKKAGKYHAQPVTVKTGKGREIRFDSRREARRFEELLALRLAGRIRDLRVHPQFTLLEAYTLPDGQRVRAVRYEADFSYYERTAGAVETWDLVVEDVKSPATKTRIYEIKRKLMLEKRGITIREVF